VSWRSGFLIFRDTTLGEAVAEFNRYNMHKIVIEDPTVAAMHVGGSFRSTNVDAFVRLLQEGFQIHVDQRDEQIVLTSNCLAHRNGTLSAGGPVPALTTIDGLS